MRKLVLQSLFVLLTCVPAFAHHPFDADYDRNKPVTLTGMVDSFQWASPHATIVLDARDAKGQMTKWTVELGNASDLGQAGWMQTSLKHGDQITVAGWAAKDGSNRANAKSVTMPGRKMLMAASSHESPAIGHATSGATHTGVGTSGKRP
jgi:uncharacterized protein DUF6152